MDFFFVFVPNAPYIGQLMQRPVSMAELEEGNAMNSPFFTILKLPKVDVVSPTHSFVWIALQAQ